MRIFCDRLGGGGGKIIIKIMAKRERELFLIVSCTYFVKLDSIVYVRCERSFHISIHPILIWREVFVDYRFKNKPHAFIEI